MKQHEIYKSPLPKEKEQLLAGKVADAVKILYESVRDRKIRQIMEELKNDNKKLLH